MVVIDEYPELMTLVELDNRKLYECRAALKDYKPDGKSDVLFPELKTVIDLYNDFVSQIRTGECGDQDTLRCFWSWFTDYNLGKNYDLMPKSSKDYKEICNNRKTINSFGGGTYYGDIYTRCRAIRQLQSSYALICQRRYGKDLFDDSMLLLLDNYQLIHDIKAKVIILDGTADLSPEYLPNRYCSENRHDFKRSLSHLHIKLINVPTGKTALKSSKEKQELLLDFVELYLSEILKCDDGISESDWAIFTYKDLEKVFKTRFKTNNVEHFGNLKGKNDFRTARHIFQVGINRYPDEVYYLLYRATNAQRTTKYKNMEEAYNYEENPYNYNFHSDEEHQDNLIMEKKKTDLNQNEVLAQSKAIEAEIKNLKGETRAIMNQLLLAEIEQNLFRGIIRNSDGQDDFTFHLFINIHQYADLIKMMRERYEPLKAEIVTVQLPKAAALLKIMNRNESTYAKRLIKWHDEELQVDEEYTPNDMRQKIGISTPVSIQSYQLLLHKTPALRGFLDGERVKRGLYKKKKNWYNLTPEN